jgi:hypothetical protein
MVVAPAITLFIGTDETELASPTWPQSLVDTLCYFPALRSPSCSPPRAPPSGVNMIEPPLVASHVSVPPSTVTGHMPLHVTAPSRRRRFL